MPELEDLTNPPAAAMVVVAHPDDIDFGIAGTAAALAAAGSDVTYCLVTAGEAGIPNEMDRRELAELRLTEQRAAADCVGVTEVMCLHQPDGHLEPNLTLRREISRAIREVKPDLLIVQSPERRWDRIFASHPDHLAVAEATMAAVYPDAQNPHAHVELLAQGLEPHKVPQVWVHGLDPMDVFIDITAQIDKKIAALSSHKSQVSWIDDVDALLRNWARDTAVAHGFDDNVLVECFRRVNTG